MTTNLPWLAAAYLQLGQLEIPGPKHNVAIVRWWDAIRAPFVDDETPWCAAFVGAMLEQSEIRSTRSAAARSYLRWGAPVVPTPGAVAVFSRPGSSWSGHVGFVVGKDANNHLLILGGNQGNRVSIAPFARARLIDCRWPEEHLALYTGRALSVLAMGAALSLNEA